MMVKSKNRFYSCAVLAVTAFFISPCDDIILSTVFGGAVFGFGSLPFYIVMAVSIVASIALWRWGKNVKAYLKAGFRRLKALSEDLVFKEMTA
jgi:hypothetical protein